MGYEVHLDVFEGPFDVLLRLINEQAVDVYEVRLAPIVDGFLAELERLEHLDLELATEFLLIAATLIELKCRRLVPGSDEIELDEELALFEARDYLLARLVESTTFQAAAAALERTEQLASRSHPRVAGPDERFIDLEVDLLASVTAQLLADVARRALAFRPPPTVETSHVHVDEVSVALTLEILAERLPRTGPITFRELTAEFETKAAIVAHFLAILELFKRELVDLDQVSTFGELGVTWIGPSGPIDLSLGDDYDQRATPDRRRSS